MGRYVMFLTQLWSGCGETEPIEVPIPLMIRFSISMFWEHGPYKLVLSIGLTAMESSSFRIEQSCIQMSCLTP